MTMLIPKLKGATRISYTSRRHLSHAISSLHLNLDALNTWIASPKSLALSDTLAPRHLANLAITLPTRDGTRTLPSLHTPPKPTYHYPQPGTLVPPGHHLAFFHPLSPEAALRPDGTEADFCPPPPFTRRMWAGGTMAWDLERPLRVDGRAMAVSSVEGVQKKGFGAEEERGKEQGKNPMVFVQQKIEVRMEGETAPSVTEERTHVYLAEGGNSRRGPRIVHGLPVPAFTFTYTPTLTTLFRFSALTFNAHHIHLDKDYAQLTEGYPERLVHGPLTALMLLEVLQFHRPGIRLRTFEYRAQNPVIVGRPQTICGAWRRQAATEPDAVDLWAVDESGIVGMTGRVVFSPESA
ncbi:hypothetical protein BJ138DRAFT_1164398 [Hygrophoropsis aurantiaca]|uniref:Uncharacterized protein n=1 Tax=Hygrophoropsis aurantiaca TaxID=72124 RepID=A0ACB7ZY62_9AGAM|nr:hypothetical protein BJ138DRAFT_1164398 [Hygrophoropsis aurantiaca]